MRIAALVAVVLLAPLASHGQSAPEPSWRMMLGAPVAHFGTAICMCEYPGEWSSYPWAAGGLVRLERAGSADWGFMAEVAAELLAPPEFAEFDHPVQARVGAGALVVLARGGAADLRLVPRAGVLYGDYGDWHFLGPWGGVVVEGVFGWSRSLGVSLGLDLRGGMWSTVSSGYGYYDSSVDGFLMAAELLLGVVIDP